MNEYEKILSDTLNYSRKRDYIGWDKHDGMSSKIRKKLPFETKWTNLFFQEVIKRAPINLRPVFLVEQRPSPKGLCLFTIANLNAFEVIGNEQYKEEGQKLIDRVVSHDLEGYDGFCLYHNHQLQGLSKKTEIGTPGIVGTSFGVKALLRASDLDKSYTELARSADNYVKSELHPKRIGTMIKVSYKPTEKTENYTLNANALAARMYIDLYDYFKIERYKRISKGILEFVTSRQTEQGGWMYTDPPSASHLSMDNYHNGFIIESILRYKDVTRSNKFDESLYKGLEFYKEILYENNGSPNWDEKNKYPKDIHAAAEGIVTFTEAGDMEFAKKILDWTLDNLYAGNGRFYYQKNKFYTKRFTLMRWCQAWMAYAISRYLVFEN